ncbi:hypothetical protein HN680_04570, partial [Candidatus Peregrinibacteria bacterium]|nr:hypothetical protein [Candidatus Peregrinibacteria bacterium]
KKQVLTQDGKLDELVDFDDFKIYGEEGYYFGMKQDGTKMKRVVRTIAGEELGFEYDDVGIPLVFDGVRYLPIQKEDGWSIKNESTGEEFLISIGLKIIGVHPLGGDSNRGYFEVVCDRGVNHIVDLEGRLRGAHNRFGFRAHMELTNPIILNDKAFAWIKIGDSDLGDKWHLIDMESGDEYALSTNPQKVIEMQGIIISAFSKKIDSMGLYVARSPGRNEYPLMGKIDHIYALEKIDEEHFYLIYKPKDEKRILKRVFDINEI